MSSLTPSVSDVAAATFMACHFAKSLESVTAVQAPKVRQAAQEAGSAIVSYFTVPTSSSPCLYHLFFQSKWVGHAQAVIDNDGVDIAFATRKCFHLCNTFDPEAYPNSGSNYVAVFELCRDIQVIRNPRQEAAASTGAARPELVSALSCSIFSSC